MSKTKAQGKAAATSSLNQQAVRNLADAIFKHLKDEGCETRDMINVSSQLLGLVTDQLKDSSSRSGQ